MSCQAIMHEFFDESLAISPQLASNLKKCSLVSVRINRHRNDKSLIFLCDRQHFPFIGDADPFICLDERFKLPLKNRIMCKLSSKHWRYPNEIVIPQQIKVSARHNRRISLLAISLCQFGMFTSLQTM